MQVKFLIVLTISRGASKSVVLCRVCRRLLWSWCSDMCAKIRSCTWPGNWLKPFTSVTRGPISTKTCTSNGSWCNGIKCRMSHTDHFIFLWNELIWLDVGKLLRNLYFLNWYICRNCRSALQWRHNGGDNVLTHQPHDCLLDRLFRRRSKRTSKLRVTGLCAGNSPATGEFPAKRASNAENIFIWWRHHGAGSHGVMLERVSDYCVWNYNQNDEMCGLRLLTPWPLGDFNLILGRKFLS